MVFTPTFRRAAASPSFGPNFTVARNFAGLTPASATRLGKLVGSFGIFGATAALFMLGEVPRVRRDILQKVPFLDTYFDRTIAPEDNPF